LTHKAKGKDLTFKAKDLTHKAKGKGLTLKAKDLTHKAKYLTHKAKDLTHKAKDLTFKAKDLTLKATHTHTHTFNGPFSGTTQVSRYQIGETHLDFIEARDSEWQWHQIYRPYASLHLAPDR